MFTYDQRTGIFTSSANVINTQGYSGSGIHKNNPNSEGLEHLGPIPRGLWAIGNPITNKELGDFVLPLIPRMSLAMYGRKNFYIHGDSILSPGNGSTGCIVLSLTIRKYIIQSNDHLLEVI